MPQISQTKIGTFLTQSDNAPTTKAKGQALEDMIRYVFERIPGVRCTNQDQTDYAQSQEIDLAFWNDNPKFKFNPILVECKNWINPVSSAEVTIFKDKLYRRGLDFGIIVAINGITGDRAYRTAAHDAIAGALQDRRRIIVLTKTDLLSLNTSQELIVLLQNKTMDLVVLRTSFI